MDRDTVIATLQSHEVELKSFGIASLSLFGSVARGESKDSSDIDLAVRLNDRGRKGGFAHFGQLEILNRRLQQILHHPVDLIIEPVRKERLREAIEKDRAVAF